MYLDSTGTVTAVDVGRELEAHGVHHTREAAVAVAATLKPDQSAAAFNRFAAWLTNTPLESQPIEEEEASSLPLPGTRGPQRHILHAAARAVCPFWLCPSSTPTRRCVGDGPDRICWMTTPEKQKDED